MKKGDLVKRCFHYWNSASSTRSLLTDRDFAQIGIIVQHDLCPKWNPRREYFVVMWSGSEGLDWRVPESIEGMNEAR